MDDIKETLNDVKNSLQELREGVDTSSKLQVCGCPNMMTLIGDKITANDLSQVVELSSSKYSGKKQSVFSKDDLEFQESRRNVKLES